MACLRWYPQMAQHSSRSRDFSVRDACWYRWTMAWIYSRFDTGLILPPFRSVRGIMSQRFSWRVPSVRFNVRQRAMLFPQLLCYNHVP